MNSMVNQAKTLAMEDPIKNRTDATKMRMFVKVTMDGIPIGRKVDLNAHNCYESLSNALEDMFLKPNTGEFGSLFFYVPLESFAGLGPRNDECFCKISFKHTRNRWSLGNKAQDTTRWVFWISTNI